MEVSLRPEPDVPKCQGCGKIRVLGVWRVVAASLMGFKINYTYCPECYGEAFSKDVA